MNDIVPTLRPIKSCFQSQYSLPSFQREYKWETKHYIELLTDIQESFRTQYQTQHGRKDVSAYRSYFLGSIITSTEIDGKKPIIDGQQRLTSLFVLMVFLLKSGRDANIRDLPDMSSLIMRTNYGTTDYAIEFSESRRRIFDVYLAQDGLPSDEVLARIESLNLDESDRRLVTALRITDGELDEDIRKVIPFFMDFLLEKITVIDIAVTSENDAHRVFVTMNDRGLRLGPIDLLKGHVLSRISNLSDNRKCHESWAHEVRTLKEIDAEEDSLFFRTFFRARWAESIRDKKTKGEESRDFEMIGDAYHRWFADRAASLGYSNSDDYVRFVEEVVYYAKIYKYVRNAETTFDENCAHIFYNGARKITLQATVLLATASPLDTDKIWRSKVSLAASFIDVIITSRAIEGRENNYDALKEPFFALTKRLRGLDPPSLASQIKKEWPEYFASVERIPEMKYAKSDRTDILYVLARLAAFLEQKLSLTNAVGFQTYWSRDRSGKTFDVEHVLKADPTGGEALGFESSFGYDTARNHLGALVLLPRSRNRSLRDKTYTEKLTAYATENVLAQSLSAGFYESNPAVAELVATYGELSHIPNFNKQSISQRGLLYTKLARAVWSAPDTAA
jgi:Protein of unknown function DUF262/Protein of unknown function (DUF1524)